MQIHFSDFFIDICIKICIWHFYIYLIPLDITVFLHINFSSCVLTVGAPVSLASVQFCICSKYREKPIYELSIERALWWVSMNVPSVHCRVKNYTLYLFWASLWPQYSSYTIKPFVKTKSETEVLIFSSCVTDPKSGCSCTAVHVKGWSERHQNGSHGALLDSAMALQW